MSLIKTLLEDKGIYAPLSNKEINAANKVNKLNGGKLVKVGKYAYQMQQVSVKESENLKAILQDEDGTEEDPIEQAGNGTTADKLEIGDPVVIKGTSYDGQEGTIESFGRDKKFVIVKLASGKFSFHSADVLASEEHDEDDNSDTQSQVASDVNKFYVAFYDTTRETSWIGKVSRENGGMWHEKVQQGKPDITWGKEHEKYMTPDDIIGLYHRKFPHSTKIEGPFNDVDDALEFVGDNWGEIRESQLFKSVSLIEDVSKFHSNALKALNVVLKRINDDQAKEEPSYSVSGAKDLKNIYRKLYGALIDGGTEEFVKAWDQAAKDNVDAFDEFADVIFEYLGVKDFPGFAKALGLSSAKVKKVNEALNADGYHLTLKNPRFMQNHSMVIHGDPREYLHDESNATARKKDKSPMLVTFQKKHQAEKMAVQLNASIVTTPSQSYRLVSKKGTTAPKKDIVEAEHRGEKVYTDFTEWKNAVKATYPELANKLKFNGRIEGGAGKKYQTISAEVPGEDRSYGVWDPKQDEGSVLFEMFGPMGGDQRNMRGSSDHKEKPDHSFKGYLEVSYPNWDVENVKKRAEKLGVKLSKAKDGDSDLRITGSKAAIATFLNNSGWNASDVRKWYPELNESAEIDEIIILEAALTEAEIKVSALKVATGLLGTLDVKKVQVPDADLDKARESSKKVLFAADGQRWYISLFQLAGGKKFARVVPPIGSDAKSYFIEPTKG